MNAQELSRLLAGRAESVAAYLLPSGKRSGSEWRVGSADGASGKSLSVRVKGDKAGVWSDFATGQGGDLLDLWCAVRGCSVSDAMRDAKQWAGVRDEPSLVSGGSPLRFSLMNRSSSGLDSIGSMAVTPRQKHTTELAAEPRP